MKNKLESIESRIDVWSLHLPSLAGEADACRGLLTPEEQRRAERFLRPADSGGFMLVRGLLRRILGGYLACPPEEIRFTRNGNGKPFVKDHPLEFNLSHSRERALIAVSAGRRVGVDIEFRRPGLHTAAIAARWFTPEEQARRQATERPEDSFFDLWAAKEAGIKAMGLSIYRDVRAFSVPEGGSRTTACGRWFFERLDIAPDYAAALAAETPAVPVIIRACGARQTAPRSEPPGCAPASSD